MDVPKLDEENSNIDFYSPEGGPGQDAAGFSAQDQQREFLGGSYRPKESEWPMGVRKSVEVNGKRWEYLEYGNPDGQPLLNVHGWLGSSAEGNERLSKALAGQVQNSTGLQNLENNVPKGAQKVRELTESLRGKYHIIAPQLPGFGHSEALDEPTLNNMADELASFGQAVGMEKPIMFGSSMGGILGIKLAARHPEAVRVLIIQGTMTQPKDMNTFYYWLGKPATFSPIKFALEKTSPAARLAKNILFKPGIKKSEDFKLAGEEGQQMILRDVDNAETRTILTTLKGIGSHLESEIDKIEAPVVVLDGVAGELVPIAKSKEIAGRFHEESPTLRDKIVDKKVMYFQVGGVAGEHGHSVINTAPEEVAVFINHAANYFAEAA